MYKTNIGNYEVNMPKFKINDDLSIAAFLPLGDVELSKVCGEELAKKLKENFTDNELKESIIVTPECKSIQMTHELCKQLNVPTFIVVRKSKKIYLGESPLSAKVHSITSNFEQELFLSKTDAKRIENKNVIVVDDVISTGQSLEVLENLIKIAGGNIIAKLAIFAEGAATKRKDIIYLKELPLFNNN